MGHDSLTRSGNVSAWACLPGIACFAPDIVVRSPITQRIRFEGVEQASDLFRRVFRIISRLRVYETIGERRSRVVFWRGPPRTKLPRRANLLRFDETGLHDQIAGSQSWQQKFDLEQRLENEHS
jgi:hypothetical protein